MFRLIPPCFYRVSVKALVLDETRTKFLIVQEKNGKWELPGGGLDWGVAPQEDLQREIKEEMGLRTTWVADHPSYFFTDFLDRVRAWRANVVYECTLEHVHFSPSRECVALAFISKENASEFDLFPNVARLVELFDPRRHQRPVQ